MLNMMNGEKKPDNEVIFRDGFLYMIIQDQAPKFDDGAKYSIAVKCLCPEYDEPMSLVDISRLYPNIQKLIFDDAMKGYIYNYGNHRCDPNAEAWELIGETMGYA